jgi:hypothetical protein
MLGGMHGGHAAPLIVPWLQDLEVVVRQLSSQYLDQIEGDASVASTLSYWRASAKHDLSQREMMEGEDKVQGPAGKRKRSKRLVGGAADSFTVAPASRWKTLYEYRRETPGMSI